MKDEAFIRQMLQKGNEAREKVTNNFSNLSLEQLDWKPSEESWSIGQCLDHLIVSDCLYFPALEKIAARKFKMGFWERWSPFNGLFGKVLQSQVQEKVKRKLKAPKILLPSASKIDAVIIERFHKHLDSLLEYIAACSQVDIDRVKITSPVSKLVTYNLRRATALLVQHEHRHINQALKVMELKEFPSPVTTS